MRLKCSDNPVPPTPPLHVWRLPRKGCQSENSCWLEAENPHVVMYSIWVLNLKRVWGSPRVLPTRYPRSGARGISLGENPQRSLLRDFPAGIVPGSLTTAVWWPWHHFLIETAEMGRVFYLFHKTLCSPNFTVCTLASFHPHPRDHHHTPPPITSRHPQSPTSFHYSITGTDSLPLSASSQP